MFRVTVVLLVAFLATTIADPEDLLVGRIVGGQESEVLRYPYQVSIRYKNCSTCAFTHRCGGIIYSSRILITSANCLSGISAKNIHVVAGSSSITATEGVVAPVESFIIHEDYDSLYIDYDVAVVKLVLDLPLDQFEIGPIELASALPKSGTSGHVTGWGSVVEGGEYSERLKVTTVTTVSDEQCKASYGATRITERMLCAGVMAGGVDSCKGDSGGPLVVNSQLVGIVSWGRGCGREGYPGVYTNVVALREWIESTIASLE